LKLMDSGNLVLIQEAANGHIWVDDPDLIIF
jgi:hypothetical protein